MPTSAFHWDDPFLLEQQLSADERAVRAAAAAYCQGQLLPRVQDMFRHEGCDPGIFREMGQLGLLGPTIDKPIVMAYVEPAQAAIGTQLNAMVRGKPVPVEVVAMPFVAPNYFRG